MLEVRGNQRKSTSYLLYIAVPQFIDAIMNSKEQRLVHFFLFHFSQKILIKQFNGKC